MEGLRSMRKAIGAALALVLVFEPMAWAYLGSKTTMYVGGTVTSIQQQTEGTSSTDDEKQFTFNYKGGKLAIPYDRINELEYGQKAGRRVGLAVGISPFFLFSKKRRHFLTINYLDENNKQQAVVFELGKYIIRTTLASLEARTGKKIEYQDEEARKSGSGG